MIPAPPQRSTSYIAAGLAASMFVLATVFLWMSYRDWRIVTDARAWPFIEGRITHNPYSPERDASTSGLEYTYEVAGRVHTGAKLVPSGWQDGSTYRQDMLKYPVGKRVRVYYDPADPSNAALTNEEPAKGSHMMAVIGFIPGLLGVGLLYLGFRLYRAGH